MSEDRDQNAEQADHIAQTEGDVEGHTFVEQNVEHVGDAERAAEEDDVEGHVIAPQNSDG